MSKENEELFGPGPAASPALTASKAPSPKAPTKETSVVVSKPQTMQPFDNPLMQEVANRVTNFMQMGALHIPDDYSVGNAIKSAELILKDLKDSSGALVLPQVKPDSVVNSLFKMVTMGLNPMKKQGSFIKYGDQLQFQPEYAGNIAMAKRYGNLKEVNGSVIYESDKFAFEVDPETGRKRLVTHKPLLENQDNNKLRGAYAITILNDGTTNLEVMNMDQIRKAWNQGATKGDSPAHKNFPDQMAIKTVISRAIKLLIRSSDDAAVIPDEDLDELPKPKVDVPQKTMVMEEIIMEAPPTQAAPAKDKPF